jgi:hypothetical protein
MNDGGRSGAEFIFVRRKGRTRRIASPRRAGLGTDCLCSCSSRGWQYSLVPDGKVPDGTFPS